MKKIKQIVGLLFLSPILAFSQNGPSQVSGNLNESINFLLQATNPIGSAAFPLSFPAFTQGSLSYGSNGVGIGKANQLFAGQIAITNGALVGTNWLDLFNMSINGSAPSDFVGNTFTVRNVKMIAIQNLGTNTSASVSEANVLDVILPGTGAAWTNAFGHPFFEDSIDSPSGASSPSITPSLIWWSPGDVGAVVGASSLSNTIVFTNPTASTVIYANVYIIGSTNQ